MDTESTVAVLGASAKPERYSNKAVALLKEHGFDVIPVTPAGGSIHGIECVKELSAIGSKVATLTIYLNPERSSALEKEILELSPGRIIFNPGTENPELEKKCSEKGIDVIEACTLVMLKTGQF